MKNNKQKKSKATIAKNPNKKLTPQKMNEMKRKHQFWVIICGVLTLICITVMVLCIVFLRRK